MTAGAFRFCAAFNIVFIISDDNKTSLKSMNEEKSHLAQGEKAAEQDDIQAN